VSLKTIKIKSKWHWQWDICKSFAFGDVGFVLFCILVVLGFELRVSLLLGRCCAALATPPALFALIILEIVSHFAQAGLDP
jgi:hypothetical protein